ncbi:MAG: hypothetical protein HEQ22_05145 [Sphingopyxis sp.]|uniref:hypothetical protein n=1 Tax=Sphingopyxis sp. TaxID=1908224 RepID=UPI003D80D312
MRRILTISLMALGGFSSATSHAMELGYESAGTINVTVIIPPLGEAVNAQEQGATGLWSILNGNDGLMINAPANVGGEDNLVVDLFSADDSQLQIRSFAGDYVVTGQPADGAAQLRQTRLALPLDNMAIWTYNPLNPRSKLYVIGTV